MEKYYINIGRQIGSGGLIIAEKLSNILNIPVYDKQLIDAAAKESGISKDFFKSADEKTCTHYWGGFMGLNFSSIFNDLSSYSPLDSCELFRIQSETIRKIAQNGSAIFVGRCADYILRDMHNCLNVFISSSKIDDRIDRFKQCDLIKDIATKSREDIIEILEKGDKKRAQYYSYYTYKQWGASESYNLCLDTSYFDIDTCAKIISTVASNTFKL